MTHRFDDADVAEMWMSLSTATVQLERDAKDLSGQGKLNAYAMAARWRALLERTQPKLPISSGESDLIA